MVNVNHKNRRGKTPLYCAVKSGHLEVVEYFLNHDESLFKPKYKKYNLLHEAAYNRKLKVLQYLAKTNVLKDFINAKDYYGNTPLHEASSGGDLKVVKYLVDVLDANVDAQNDKGKTVVHRAAFSGKLSVVRYLVEDQKLYVDAVDKTGSTPLHDATYGGSIDVVRYLVTAGADVHKTNQYRRTPLFGAVKNPHFEVMQYLIEEKKCLVDLRDYEGKTPLQIAVKNANKPAIEYLEARMNRC